MPERYFVLAAQMQALVQKQGKGKVLILVLAFALTQLPVSRPFSGKRRLCL